MTNQASRITEQETQISSHNAKSPGDSTFAIGVHRPVYLWGGPGTVRMNRLKFMDAPVDEAVHAEAHTRVGAQRMSQEAAFSWAYLMYDWGFPPEVEEEDWEDFERAVKVYQEAGMKVFGYVQFSNCVFDGSYRDKDWYVLDPKGRPFYYYTGRYMTCISHPEWLEHLREMVRGVVEAGADGVYIDNPWHGIQPIHLGGAWMGPAGCYCALCRDAFRQAAGLEIPVSIAPATDEASQRYLGWRAKQITETMAMLGAYARSLENETVLGANDYDAVMRPSYVVHGIDLRALAAVQNVVMIEDFCLPRWQRGTLTNNALTLRTARALIGDTPLSTDPYDRGIGWDDVYPSRRFQQGIAEAAACGSTMVVKGTEYVDGEGTFTLLTAERYGPQREAIGQIHRWLKRHTDLYRERVNAAPVGLMHPGDAMWQDWDRLAPLYFGAGQTLLAAGIPWRVVTANDDLSALEILLCFGEVAADVDASRAPRVIPVPQLPGWEPASPSFLARHNTLRAGASGVVGWLFQAYFRWRWARSMGEGLGLARLYTQSPLFQLPPEPMQQALLEALGEKPYPQVGSPAPVLVELWHKGETRQLHLVNYGEDAQQVSVDLGERVSGQRLSPDGPDEAFAGERCEFLLNVYTILEYSGGLAAGVDESPLA